MGLGVSWLESYRHFLSFGETLLDKIIVWTGSIDPGQVDFPNRKLLLDLLGQKRGAMILSGHIGNLEICQAIANLRGHIHLNILVHTKHAEKFNRLLGGGGGSATIQLIQVTELNPAIAIELQEKIEHGEFLVLVGDRIPVKGSRTVRASFLGKDAEFPQGPYLLASLMRCPVYTLFCYPATGASRSIWNYLPNPSASRAQSRNVGRCSKPWQDAMPNGLKPIVEPHRSSGSIFTPIGTCRPTQKEARRVQRQSANDPSRSGVDGAFL